MLTRILFALARLAFGAKFARDGYENLRDIDDMVGFADSVGVPFAGVLVPAASAVLLVGGAALALGLAPLLGVAGIAVFLLGVTPQMHDFWNREGDERDEELDAFVRNASFLGAAVAFGLASRQSRGSDDADDGHEVTAADADEDGDDATLPLLG